MKLKKIRVSLLFFQLITVVVYGHTQNLLEINEQFDEKLYQNHTIAKHLLNKQRLLVKELEDENHPLFLENLGDYYLSIFRLDSAQHFYSKAYSSANMKEVKEMLELKQKLTAYKTCIKSETPFDHTPYSHLSESSIIEIENAFDYKFYDDSIANMIRSVDPSTLREKVFLYEYYRLKVEMIAHDKPEAGLKEIYNLIHNPIVKKDTQIIVKLLCIKSFYETITLSYKRAVATLDLAETLCNNPNLKNEIALRRGFALRRQQKFDRALEILKKVKAFYSQSSNQFDEVKTLYHIAAIYEDQGLKDSAIIHFEEAAEIEKTFPNARKAVNIYARLGSCYADVGQTFKALKNYKFCESWSIQFGALNTLSSAYSAQADLYYYQLKDYESAAEYYQKYA
ncbi:MAG: tetratricopeptide repeat protein, partial [Flavobacteriales bacterium]|nr:tetratricopeptide repeat protein [Flavobacteriales bacterium]